MKFEYWRYDDMFEVSGGYVGSDWSAKTLKTYKHVFRLQLGRHEWSLFMVEVKNEET